MNEYMCFLVYVGSLNGDMMDCLECAVKIHNSLVPEFPFESMSWLEKLLPLHVINGKIIFKVENIFEVEVIENNNERNIN